MFNKSAEQLDQDFEFEVVMVNSFGEVKEQRTHTARQFIEHLGGGESLEMVEVPGGTFLMGSRAGHGYEDEQPLRSVRISPFLMGKYPVTQGQWKAIMEWLPPYRCKGAKRPADRVSWNDARAFCERLSQRTGRAYRLPSEAEWEYACRARSMTPFYFGETITTDLANYVGEYTYSQEPKGIYRHETTDVGSFPPNVFGLYDMHGNVWEWCADGWHDDYVGAPRDGRVWQSGESVYRVLRGGCWHDTPGLCRCAARLRHNASEGEDFFGFRIAISRA